MRNIKKLEALIKLYAQQFGLDYQDDTSEWSDDIPGIIGACAYEPSLSHEPPSIFICTQNIFNEKVLHNSPYIYFTRDFDLLNDDDYPQRIVKTEELENAIKNNKKISF